MGQRNIREYFETWYITCLHQRKVLPIVIPINFEAIVPIIMLLISKTIGGKLQNLKMISLNGDK